MSLEIRPPYVVDFRRETSSSLEWFHVQIFGTALHRVLDRSCGCFNLIKICNKVDRGQFC